MTLLSFVEDSSPSHRSLKVVYSFEPSRAILSTDATCVTSSWVIIEKEKEVGLYFHCRNGWI